MWRFFFKAIQGQIWHFSLHFLQFLVALKSLLIEELNKRGTSLIIRLA